MRVRHRDILPYAERKEKQTNVEVNEHMFNVHSIDQFGLFGRVDKKDIAYWAAKYA